MRDDEPRPVWMSLPITEVCVVGPIKRVCVYYCSTCYKAVFLLLKYRVFFTCLLQCLLLTKLHDVLFVCFQDFPTGASWKSSSGGSRKVRKISKIIWCSKLLPRNFRQRI